MSQRLGRMIEYTTVDVPVHKDRLLVDVTVSLMAQEGWRPIVLISPADNYPHNSIVFEKGETTYD